MRTISTGRAPAGHPQAYTVRTEPIDGTYHTYVTVHCISCGEATELHWNTGGNHPDYIARKLRGMGWQFDAFKPRRCVCPECRTKPRIPGITTIIDGVVSSFTSEVNNIPSSQEEPMATTQKPDFTTAAREAARRSQAGTPMPVPVEDPPVPRPLTAHEKQKVRLLLDSHFDDDKGRYIDGYDDRRIGEEANVPWALVTEIRELAYGPLKEDPNVVAFKAEAVELRNEFTQLSNALDAARQRCAQLEGRLINVEARAKRL